VGALVQNGEASPLRVATGVAANSGSIAPSPPLASQSRTARLNVRFSFEGKLLFYHWASARVEHG
jgi:hypothetical protein